MTSAETIQGPDAGAINVYVDRSAWKLGGWAAPADPRDTAEELVLRLVAGSVLLGTLRRDRAGPNTKKSNDGAAAKTGFEVPDYGLAAFARMTGLQGITIGADVGSERATEVPIEQELTNSSPLGLRHGLGKALRLVDLWLEGSRNLSLRFEGKAATAKSLDAYQCIDAKLISVAVARP